MTRMPSNTLTLTVGLPASGKTTWANQQVAADPNVVVLCLDDLRAELFPDQPWSLPRVTAAGRLQESRARHILDHGLDLIIADTNLNPTIRNSWAALAADAGARLHHVVFDVPVTECVRRDAARANPVGENVIRSAARRYGPVAAIAATLPATTDQEVAA